MHLAYFYNLSNKVPYRLKNCPNFANVILILISKWKLISKSFPIIKALTGFLILSNRTLNTDMHAGICFGQESVVNVRVVKLLLNIKMETYQQNFP